MTSGFQVLNWGASTKERNLEFYAAYFKLLTVAHAGNGYMGVTCYDMLLASYTRIGVNNITLSCVSCYFVLGNVSCLLPARANIDHCPNFLAA
jgi:hypothetical protein